MMHNYDSVQIVRSIVRRVVNSELLIDVGCEAAVPVQAER